MLQDSLADVLSALKNAEKVGKRECVTRASKLANSVLKIFQDAGYVKSFEFIDDGKSGKFKIELRGKIIDCNAVKPRFSVRVDEFEKYEKRFLPGREFGLLILTTPKGIMNHKKAKELRVGGKLLAYVF
jgi:small subunit ribosomal protein S8